MIPLTDLERAWGYVAVEIRNGKEYLIKANGSFSPRQSGGVSIPSSFT